MNTEKAQAGCQCCDKCECYKEGKLCSKDGKKGEGCGCGCKNGCECCPKCNCKENESCCSYKKEKKCCCGENK